MFAKNESNLYKNKIELNVLDWYMPDLSGWLRNMWRFDLKMSYFFIIKSSKIIPIKIYSVK